MTVIYSLILSQSIRDIPKNSLYGSQDKYVFLRYMINLATSQHKKRSWYFHIIFIFNRKKDYILPFLSTCIYNVCTKYVQELTK